MCVCVHACVRVRVYVRACVRVRSVPVDGRAVSMDGRSVDQ